MEIILENNFFFFEFEGFILCSIFVYIYIYIATKVLVLSTIIKEINLSRKI